MLLFGVALDVLRMSRRKLRPLAVASESGSRHCPRSRPPPKRGSRRRNRDLAGAFAPEGTSQEIVTRLNAEINRVLEMPDVRERIAPGGIGEPKGGTPEQFGALVRSEITKWARVVKESGAKAD
jgi:tripartite-type tricarboxylate transporter receptor subunit TctC